MCVKAPGDDGRACRPAAETLIKNGEGSGQESDERQ